MAIKISFDVNHNPIPPTLILANRNGNKLGVISDAYEINVSDALSEIPTITFKVSKDNNTVSSSLWNLIDDLKLVWCQEWDFWFEITVELEDGDDTIKSVQCSALCQSELSQVNLYDIQINTEDDIAREDYEIPTTIYNTDYPEASLLMRISEKIPHYKIKHVDSTIAGIQRTFEFDGISIMDTLNEIAEEIGALVVYGNGSVDDPNGELGKIPERSISLYDLETNCLSCGYRGEFTDKCPECGSTELREGYGNDTTIFISKDNLTDAVTVTTDIDNVKNCFRLVAGDDLMTATVRNCNPNGTGYIWCITDEVMADMSSDLVDKLKSYQKDHDYYSHTYSCQIDGAKINSYNSLIDKYKQYKGDLQKISTPIIGFSQLMNVLYDTIDFNLYLSDEMMPTPEIDKVTAQDQVKLLTAANLSPCAVTNFDTISELTVDSNVLSVARVFIRQNYQVKIASSEYNKGSHIWRGNFTVTSYSDPEDTATSNAVSIIITDNYEQYIKQTLDKTLKNSEKDNYLITSIFKKALTQFSADLKKYGLAMLKEFHECCQSCLDVLVEQGISDLETWGNENPNLYGIFYLDYLQKLSAIDAEMSVRESDIKTIDSLMNAIETERTSIQDKLDFQKYLGDTLWKQFCAYRRESEYSNNNYISDGLSNAELFKQAREFFKTAEDEIYKSANLQMHMSSTLRNLLTIKEFEKLLDYFEVGNWLRIEADDEIYKLRLIKYDIDYDNLETVSVEFSDVLKVKDGRSDADSILSKASSISSTYAAVEKQASKGEKSSQYIDTWHKDGLDATLMRIVNNAENQDIVWDSHGMIFRKYDEVIEGYSPRQLKIINSTIAVTDDNWLSTKTAIGYFMYKNPRSGKLETAYGINGELIVGKLLLGEALAIYNSAGTLTFDENGFNITNGINSFTVNPNSQKLFALGNSEQGDMLWVDDKGMLHITGDGAGLDITANDYINEMVGHIQANAAGLEAEFTRATNAEGELSGRITVNAGLIQSEVERAQGAEGTLSTTITQTAKEIREEVKNTKEGLESSITQNAGEIKSLVESTKGLETSITQTQEYIESKASELDGKITSSVKQSAEELTSTFNNTISGLSSTLSQTADGLEAEITRATGAEDDLSARIKANAEGIELRVKDSDFVSVFEQKAEGINIIGKMFTWSATNSSMDSDGTFTCTNGSFSGNITATSGEIGPWTIDMDAIYLTTDGKTAFFGTSGINVNNNFIVDSSGNATFNGSIVLSGNITWSSTNSPAQAVYARSSITKPLNGTKYSSFSTSSSTTWHTIYDITNDYYQSLTYDGGATWTNPIKIKGTDGINGKDGKDGKDGEQGPQGIQGPRGFQGIQGDPGPRGADGSDATVTRNNIVNALKSAYANDGIFSYDYYGTSIIGIRASAIVSGTMSASFIEGGTLRIKDVLQIYHDDYGSYRTIINSGWTNNNVGTLQIGLIGTQSNFAYFACHSTEETTICASKIVQMGQQGGATVNCGKVNETSDKRLKEQIARFTQEHEEAYMDLCPVSFRFKNFENEIHDRPHYGFIAQDVIDAFSKHGMSTSDFGIVCKSQISEGSTETYGIDETDGLYYLHYTEFIALNTHMTQKALRRQKEQDDIIKKQESQIQELKQMTLLLMNEIETLKKQMEG